MVKIRFESFALSETGYVRTNNEDAWHILQEKQFFVLADGMGGHNAGEVAAALTVDSLCHSIQAVKEESSIEETCYLLRQAVTTANHRVFNTSRQEPQYHGMGTTLCCCLIKENYLIYASVGDSRLYRYRNQLEQLTKDHSLRTHPLYAHSCRHVITRAIGASSTIYPDIGVIPLYDNDLYLLCSDGLSDYVEAHSLSALLSSAHSLEKMGTHLLQAALEKGGNDNITLLLLKISQTV